jgi:hypothetical protein
MAIMQSYPIIPNLFPADNSFFGLQRLTKVERLCYTLGAGLIFGLQRLTKVERLCYTLGAGLKLT